MKTARSLVIALLLVVGAASARAEEKDPLEGSGAWRWRRHIEFAHMLGNRSWFDIIDEVVQRLEAREDIIGREKASMWRDLGQLFEELAPARARKQGMQGFIDYVGRARSYYQKTIDYLVKRSPTRYAGEIARLRGRQSWLAMSVAEAHARFLDDPAVSEADKKKHRDAASKIYNDAVGNFQKAGVQKKQYADKEKGRKPTDPDSKEYKEWDRRYKEARADHFRTRLYLNEARLRFARFLRETKSKGWVDPLKAAEADLYKLLLEFSGTPGAKQANLNYGIVLAEQHDPKKDKSALDRLGEIWRQRAHSPQRRLPCEAAVWIARIHLRQKKLDEVVKGLHEMLQYRSGGAWKPEAPIMPDNVVGFLLDNEDADKEDFDQKAIAEAFLLFADTFAEKAKKAQAAKQPPRRVRSLYGTAYDIASGVRTVRRSVGAERIATVERWRREAKRPRSIQDIRDRITQALTKASESKDPAEKKAQYLKAAELLVKFLARKDAPKEGRREQWLLAGQCYYFAERYLEAYTVWTGYTRWYPKPLGARLEAAGFAVGAAQKIGASEKGDFSADLLSKAKRWREVVNEDEGGAVIQYGRELRGEKKFQDALDQFKKVSDKHDLYPRALYEIGITYRDMHRALPADERRGAKGARYRATMVKAQEKVLSEFAKWQPKLSASEDEDDERKLKGMAEVAAGALLQLCNAHSQGTHPQADINQIIALTDDMAKKHPGVETSTYAPVLYFLRLQTSYKLQEAMKTVDEKALQRLSAVVEAAWTTLKGFPEFNYLSHACATAATFHLKVSKKIRDAAGAIPDPVVLERITKIESRALALYLELFNIAPKQPINTYRYVIGRFKARGGIVDYRAIVTVAGTCVKTYGGTRTALLDEGFPLVMGEYGTALARTEAYAKAKSVLAEADSVFEKGYQERLGKWKKRDAAYREDRLRHPHPGLKPVRRSAHRAVREWLARSYLETNDKGKYDEAIDIYNDLMFGLRRSADQASKEKYVDLLYWLCEALLRKGKLDAGLGLLTRGMLSYGKIISTRAQAPRYRALLTRYRHAAGNNKALLDIINDILKQLK